MYDCPYGFGAKRSRRRLRSPRETALLTSWVCSSVCPARHTTETDRLTDQDKQTEPDRPRQADRDKQSETDRLRETIDIACVCVCVCVTCVLLTDRDRQTDTDSMPWSWTRMLSSRWHWQIAMISFRGLRALFYYEGRFLSIMAFRTLSSASNKGYGPCVLQSLFVQLAQWCSKHGGHSSWIGWHPVASLMRSASDLVNVLVSVTPPGSLSFCGKVTSWRLSSMVFFRLKAQGLFIFLKIRLLL